MNIFYLHTDPIIAAQYHNDKHVVKMILEYAQLLSTAHRILDDNKSTELYKATHKNHPSAVWVRANINNYNWLYNLFIALCDEYTFRYNKVHLTDSKLRLHLKTPPINIAHDQFYQPTQAMPIEYHQDDSIAAYREYYINSKDHLASWTKRGKPDWYPDKQKQNDFVIILSDIVFKFKFNESLQSLNSPTDKIFEPAHINK